jgi:putative transcriptional regulator
MTEKKNAYLTGKLLLSMPALAGEEDPRFHKAVIFVASHNGDGAMGLIINYPVMNLTFEDLLKEIGIPVPSGTALPHLTILSGGPVETGRGFILHTSDFREDNTIEVDSRFSVTATIEALEAVALGTGPKEMLFVLGYSGWGAGQLEGELQRNAWMVADADHEILFNTKSDDMWDRTFARMGVNPSLLARTGGTA